MSADQIISWALAFSVGLVIGGACVLAGVAWEYGRRAKQEFREMNKRASREDLQW